MRLNGIATVDNNEDDSGGDSIKIYYQLNEQ